MTAPLFRCAPLRFGLLTALALSGCAAPSSTPSSVGLPHVSFALSVSNPAGAAAIGVSEADVSSALRAIAQPAAAVQPETPGTAASVVAPASSGGGGGSATPVVSAAAALFSVGRYSLDRIAGTPVTEGPLSQPFLQVAGVAVDPADQMVFACDPLRHQVRAVVPGGESWIVAGAADGVSGFDGDGVTATVSQVNAPAGLVYDVPSATLLLADSGNHRIRYFQPGGLMYTLAGGGQDASDVVGAASAAMLGEPFGLAEDTAGNVWFDERDTGKVRWVTPMGRVTTLATLPGGRAGALAVDPVSGKGWVTDDRAIYRIDPAASPVLNPVPLYAPPGVCITAIAYSQHGALFVATTSSQSPGTTDTHIWRLPLRPNGALGLPLELVAGKGGAGQPSDYVLPAATVPDAALQLLAGAGFCSLALDETGSTDVVYSGTSYSAADPAAFRAELFKLTPFSTTTP